MILIKDRHDNATELGIRSRFSGNMILIKDRHKRVADKQSANHAREI